MLLDMYTFRAINVGNRIGIFSSFQIKVKKRNQAVKLQKMYLKTLLLAAIRDETDKNPCNTAATTTRATTPTKTSRSADRTQETLGLIQAEPRHKMFSAHFFVGSFLLPVVVIVR